MTAPEELVEAVHAALVAVWADRPLVDYVPGHDEARAAIAAVRAYDTEQMCPCDVARRSGACCRETVL